MDAVDAFLVLCDRDGVLRNVSVGGQGCGGVKEGNYLVSVLTLEGATRHIAQARYVRPDITLC